MANIWVLMGSNLQVPNIVLLTTHEWYSKSRFHVPEDGCGQCMSHIYKVQRLRIAMSVMHALSLCIYL